jgi:signal peptidase II
MESKHIIRIVAIFVVLIANVGCDQISKNIARKSLSHDETIGLFNDYVTIMRVENTGAFLSAGHNLPPTLKMLLLTILPVFILVVGLLYVLTKNFSKITTLSICFVIGGGAGNIYDRVMHGSVTDFLHIDFVVFQTGIFNMADVSIMVGMFLIVGESIVKQFTAYQQETTD